MKHTTGINKKVYIYWYNLARRILKEDFLIPPRNDDEILDLISDENWLLFCQKGDTKEIAIQKDEPNVFLRLKNGVGTQYSIGLGLTFNNLKSYDRFKTIMKGPNRELKEKIVSKLNSPKYSWTITLQRKIKNYNYAQSPEYILNKNWNTIDINETIIEDIVARAEIIREQGRELSQKRKLEDKYYRETPSINLMESVFGIDENEFEGRLLEIFEILALCLQIKSEAGIKRLAREKKKLLDNKQKELKKKEALKSHLQLLKSISPKKINNEEILQLENEIGTLKKFIKEEISKETVP